MVNAVESPVNFVWRDPHNEVDNPLAVPPWLKQGTILAKIKSRLKQPFKKPWMFGETTLFSQIKMWNHPVETTMKKMIHLGYQVSSQIIIFHQPRFP